MSKARDTANVLSNELLNTDYFEVSNNASGDKRLHIKADGGHALMFDDVGSKGISINDGAGNFHLVSGVGDANEHKVSSDNNSSGAAKLGFASDGTSGYIYAGRADVGTTGNTPSWDMGWRLDESGLFASDNVNADGLHNATSMNDRRQIASQDGAFGKAICKAWASFEQNGTHSLFRSFNCSSISDQGTGYSRIAMNRTTYIANDAAVTVGENPNGDGGNGGGPDAAWNNPYAISNGSIQFDLRNTSNSGTDKRYAAFVLYS